MPRESIVGSGRKGFGFEQKGFQERNLQTMLESLSKKTTQKSIESLANIDDKKWAQIAETSLYLKEFVELGGMNQAITDMKNSILETINLKISELLAPITNEVNQKIEDLLAPFLAETITPVVNDLATFMAENGVGTGVGGIAGGVIGAFVGHPAIGAFIGAIIGAALEAWSNIDLLTEEQVLEGGLLGFAEWQQNNRDWSTTYADYLAWIAEQTKDDNSYIDPWTGRF